jgi:hypothetical protein
MFIALRDGQFDALVEDGQAARDKALAVPAAADSAFPRNEAPSTESLPVVTDPPPAAAAAPSGPPKTGGTPVPPPGDDVDMVPRTTRTPEITLELDALERGASSPGSSHRLSDLPPPPANVFRDRSATGGAYRSSPPATSDATGKRASGIPPKKVPSAPPKKVPSAPPKKPGSIPPSREKSPSEGRYAIARPAAIFGQVRAQQGSGIFGEDLISDKSLDEVILSYLAEDLEPPPEKKK